MILFNLRYFILITTAHTKASVCPVYMLRCAILLLNGRTQRTVLPLEDTAHLKHNGKLIDCILRHCNITLCAWVCFSKMYPSILTCAVVFYSIITL